MAKTNAIDTTTQEFQTLNSREKIQLFKEKIIEKNYETLQITYKKSPYVTLYLINKTYDSFHLYGIFEPNIDELSGKDGIVAEMYVNAKNKEFYVNRNLKEVQFSTRNIRGMLRFANREEFFDFIEHSSIKGVFKDLYEIGFLERGKARGMSYPLNDFFEDYIVKLHQYEQLVKVGLPPRQLYDLNREGYLDLQSTKIHDILGLTKGAWKLLSQSDVINNTYRTITNIFSEPKLGEMLGKHESPLWQIIVERYDSETQELVVSPGYLASATSRYYLYFGVEDFLALPINKQLSFYDRWRIEHQNLMLYLYRQSQYYGLEFRFPLSFRNYVEYKLIHKYVAPKILSNGVVDRDKALRWLQKNLPTKTYEATSEANWMNIVHRNYNLVEGLVRLMIFYQGNISRLFNYLQFEIYVEQGITSYRKAAGLLHDYTQMNRDMNATSVSRFPKSLILEHDVAAMNYKVVIDSEKEERWKQWYEENVDLGFIPKSDSSRYAVTLPKTPQELVKEGNELSHCVGSYIDSVLKGATSVLFVRNKEELDQPLYTMEIRGDKITQLRGRFNQSATKTVKDFVKNYAQEKNLGINYG